MVDAARPLVSVVIPCFNQARYLAAAVHSARAQPYTPVQILVVDDGSTDDSSAVALAAGARVIRQSNRGVSIARNVGLAAASGEFVVCLDADDLLLPGSLEISVRTLLAHPDAACAVGRCTAIDEHGREAPHRLPDVDTSDLYAAWLSQNFVWAPAAAMFRRRDLLAIGGFPHRHHGAADWAVYLAFARQRRVVDHGRTIAAYRMHRASMSRRPARMLVDVLRVLDHEQRRAPAVHRTAFAPARRAWTAWYGEQIVDDLRRAWREGRIGTADLESAVTLLRHAPGVAVRHLRRKLRRVAGERAALPASARPHK